MERKVGKYLIDIAEEINKIKYDRIYKNNGTLKDLANTAGDFVEEIIHARRY